MNTSPFYLKKKKKSEGDAGVNRCMFSYPSALTWMEDIVLEAVELHVCGNDLGEKLPYIASLTHTTTISC